jgi:hypothetical protein
MLGLSLPGYQYPAMIFALKDVPVLGTFFKII